MNKHIEGKRIFKINGKPEFYVIPVAGSHETIIKEFFNNIAVKRYFAENQIKAIKYWYADDLTIFDITTTTKGNT